MTDQTITGITKSVYIPLDLLNRIQHQAIVEDRSDSNMICRLLLEALQKRESEERAPAPLDQN